MVSTPQGDIILVGLREYQDEKADVILKYLADEARNLKQYGELPEHSACSGVCCAQNCFTCFSQFALTRQTLVTRLLMRTATSLTLWTWKVCYTESMVHQCMVHNAASSQTSNLVVTRFCCVFNHMIACHPFLAVAAACIAAAVQSAVTCPARHAGADQQQSGIVCTFDAVHSGH